MSYLKESISLDEFTGIVKKELKGLENLSTRDLDIIIRIFNGAVKRKEPSLHG